MVEVGVNGRDGDLAEYVPARYAGVPESAYLICVPISAARRWLGVIFADREGEDFPLEDGERETMMTLDGWPPSPPRSSTRPSSAKASAGWPNGSS